MTFYYFAYGSNMLTERLKRRCRGVIGVGRADAADYEIEFSKRSKDKSGKATLRHAIGGETPGFLFKIPLTERDRLDKFEGAGKGKGYERHDAFPVRLLDDGKILEATTYLATCPDISLKPYDWYLALVIAGALEHKISGDYIEKLRRIESMPDLNHKRRLEAIEELSKAGIPDYSKLLLPA